MDVDEDVDVVVAGRARVVDFIRAVLPRRRVTSARAADILS